MRPLNIFFFFPREKIIYLDLDFFENKKHSNFNEDIFQLFFSGFSNPNVHTITLYIIQKIILEKTSYLSFLYIPGLIGLVCKGFFLGNLAGCQSGCVIRWFLSTYLQTAAITLFTDTFSYVLRIQFHFFLLRNLKRKWQYLTPTWGHTRNSTMFTSDVTTWFTGRFGWRRKFLLTSYSSVSCYSTCSWSCSIQFVI